MLCLLDSNYRGLKCSQFLRTWCALSYTGIEVSLIIGAAYTHLSPHSALFVQASQQGVCLLEQS